MRWYGVRWTRAQQYIAGGVEFLYSDLGRAIIKPERDANHSVEEEMIKSRYYCRLSVEHVLIATI